MNKTTKKKPPVGMLVEDSTVSAGVTESGQTVIAAKTPTGHAPKMVKPTDRREVYDPDRDLR